MNKLDYYLFKISGMFLTFYFMCKDSCKKSKFLQYIAKPFVYCKKKVQKKKIISVHEDIVITKVYIVKNITKKGKLKIQRNEIQNFDIQKKNIPKLQVGDIIEIHYTVYYIENDIIVSKEYIAPYMHPSNIQFPPYTLEEIKQYKDGKTYKNGILDASCNKDDITEYITKLAGPKNNFYKDIPSRYGIRILLSLVQKKPTDTIEITDNFAKDYIFTKPTETLQIDS